MFLLPVVLVGVLVGFLLGGRLDRIADVRLRAPWLFYAAIALQLLAFPSLFMPWRASEGIATALSIGSYVCLLARFPLEQGAARHPVARGRGVVEPAAVPPHRGP